MWREFSIWTILFCTCLSFAGTGWADVPPPPVNQTIGKPDIAFSGLGESDCRACHSSGVPNRHHLLTGDLIPPGSLVPYPDADGDGTADSVYGCVNCHNVHSGLVRNCTSCHTGSSPHHTTPEATSGNCKACHGSIVDNPSDGHYVPTYSPSLVTPSPDDCGDCHGASGNILSIQDLHHGTGLLTCEWCHSLSGGTEPIRMCEQCHGPGSLHNIQADSPASRNIGTIVVGGENAGYGHVGRDAGPTDSDCWGCHGFAQAALAPLSGPLVPTVRDARPAVAKAGTDTLVVLFGSAFTNTASGATFESKVLLTAADGSSVTLTPGALGESLLAVTIPGNTAPGNYNLQALKTSSAGAPVTSNPLVISIVPEVAITRVTSDGMVTIEGKGFGGYAEGLGTSVTGTIAAGQDEAPTTVEATIISWSDTLIKADFGASPQEVTVNSVFGASTYAIGGKPD